jgi:hemerythrin-like domain-containing protein
LHHHHHAEEALLFPMVLRQTGVAPEELVTDHEELTAAIAEVQASFVTGRNRERAMRAVASFDEMLVAHLAREESLVVPSCSSFPPSEPGP